MIDLRHSRNIPALTPAEQDVLSRKTVAVIGCGGLGGHLIELLTRIGVGSIRAVDGDVFEETNLNRQLLSSISSLGRSKAEAAGERAAAIDPGVRVTAFPVFLTRENARELLSGCEAVLDGLDNIDARHILSDACLELGIPLVYGAICGWTAQWGISMPGDCLIDTLFPAGVEIRDKSVLSFTPALCASMQASLCTRLLIGRPVQTGTVFCFDLLHDEFESIPLA